MAFAISIQTDSSPIEAILKKLSDFDAYKEKKEEALEAYADQKAWAKKALINIAKAGYFSSDRTIEEYNQDIWKL